MRAFSVTDTATRLATQSELEGKTYTRRNLDEAVADLIATGHPAPQTRLEWRRLRATVRKALPKSKRNTD